jgi:hypothetical protein
MNISDYSSTRIATLEEGEHIMAEAICERVSPGMRSSERIVLLRDVYGRREFVQVDSNFLTVQGDKHYLPVGVVHEDKTQGLVLIELPEEAVSGANRLWARSTDLLPDHRVPA